MGGALFLRRSPAPEGLGALAQGRSRRRRTKLPRFAHLGTPPAGQILGAAHVDEPRTAVAEPRQTPGRLRATRPGLRLVHRRLRYEGSAGGKGSACRTQV